MPAKAACSSCGKTVQRGRTSRPEITCHECRRANPNPYGPRASKPPKPPQVCEQCGESFVPGLRASYRLPARFCSKSCATTWRLLGRPGKARLTPEQRQQRKQARYLAKSRKRRMRLGAVPWDGITDAAIMERDRWRCGICRKAIGRSFRYPHPRSKSIDHIVPISQGGDDTAANKRAAHLGCNSGRANRGGGEQLAMIG